MVAMGLAKEEIQGAVRMSWCHLTEDPDVESMVARLTRLIDR